MYDWCEPVYWTSSGSVSYSLTVLTIQYSHNGIDTYSDLFHPLEKRVAFLFVCWVHISWESGITFSENTFHLVGLEPKSSLATTKMLCYRATTEPTPYINTYLRRTNTHVHTWIKSHMRVHTHICPSTFNSKYSLIHITCNFHNPTK